MSSSQSSSSPVSTHPPPHSRSRFCRRFSKFGLMANLWGVGRRGGDIFLVFRARKLGVIYPIKPVDSCASFPGFRPSLCSPPRFVSKNPPTPAKSFSPRILYISSSEIGFLNSLAKWICVQGLELCYGVVILLKIVAWV